MGIFDGKDTFLIDLDDTIFDFGRAEAVAICAAFAEAGIEPSEELIRDYSEINRAVWKELERGEITREVLLTERFRRLYEKRGIDKDPKEAGLLYPQKLALGHYWLPGARDAIIKLSRTFDVYVASNGTSWIQRSRISTSDLEQLVKGIFVSQEMGADKPSPVYFDNVFKELGIGRERCVMVGDSLTSDILGGKNAGLVTVWVNTNRLPEDRDIVPDLTVRSLGEFADMLFGDGIR